MDLARRLEFAVAAAREAGDLTLQYFQRPDLVVDRKRDNTPITAADRGAEQLLRERIAAQYPADAVLGEEFGESEGSSGYRWILDPIDGTKAFMCGVPLYGTLVGLQHGSRSVLGVIHVPALDETVYAAQGSGAWYRKGNRDITRASVSRRESLADSVFLASQVNLFGKRGAADVFERLEAATYVTRTWGDCYGYLLVATGRAEVMIDALLNLWDAAALQPVIEEAGGSFTDWQGNPTIHAREAIATNGLVLQQVLEITRTSPRAS